MQRDRSKTIIKTMDELTGIGEELKKARGSPELARLRRQAADFLKSRLPFILADIDLQVGTSIPAYDRLPPEILVEARESFRDFLLVYIDYFESGNLPIKKLKSIATESGKRRAAQGFSLSAVIDAFDAGETYVWKTLTAELLPRGYSAEAWVELAAMRDRFDKLARKYLRRAYRIEEESAIKKQLDELRAITNLGQAIVSTVDLEQVLGQILEVATSFMQVKMGVIMLLDETGHYLQPVVDKGISHLFSRPGRLLVNRTISGLAITRGEYVLGIDDELSDFELPRPLAGKGIRSVLSIPIRVNDEVIGVIELYDTEPRRYTDFDIAMMMAFSPQAGVAIKNARLFRDEKRRRKQAVVLSEMAQAVSEAKDLEDLLERISEKVAVALGADRSSLFFYDHEANSLTFMAGYGRSTLQTWLLHQFHLPVSQLGRSTIKAIRLRKPVFVPNPVDELSLESRVFRASGVGAYLQIPIIFEEEVVGLISLEFSSPETVLKDEDLALAETLASHAAMAIQNRRLQQKILEQQIAIRNAEINERLFRERERSEAILRATPDAVFLVDSDRRIRLINPAAQSLTGWELEDARGRYCHEVLFRSEPSGGVCPDPECPISRVLAGEEVPYKETDIVTKSGFIVPSGGTFAKISKPDGSVESVVAIYRDVSEQKELAKLDIINKEMDIASGIQSSLLPRDRLLSGGVVVSGFQQQARMVGGDWYDYWGYGDKIYLIIGDASGTGAGAAILATIAMSTLRVEAREHEDIGVVLKHLNEALYQTDSPESFVTAFFGVLDLNTMSLTYANAGHEDPLCIGSETKFPEALASETRSILGAFPDPQISVMHRKFNSGERVVLYTDGVIDAKDSRGRLFGLKRLNRFVAANRALPPDDFIHALIDNVLEFCEGEVRDDITVLVCDIP